MRRPSRQPIGKPFQGGRQISGGDMIRNSLRLFGTVLIFCAWLAPSHTDAGTIYLCEDRAGSVAISDYPLAGKKCRPSATFRDVTPEEKANAEKEQEKEREAQEKKRTAEAEKRKAAEDLAACYESARSRRLNCVGRFTDLDDSVVYNLTTQCDAKLQEEMDECEKRYPQKP